MLKSAVRQLARVLGYEVRNLRPPPPPPPPNIPDGELYQPLFSPWHAKQGDFPRYFAVAQPRTLVSADRCYVLYTLIRNCGAVPGDVWECGVYRGGTARMFTQILEDHASEKKVYLFDTFAGMPETDQRLDLHLRGDFSDTSLASVMQFVGHSSRCVFRPGFIPKTFDGLENRIISFAHIDVDIHDSVRNSLAFIWPRLSAGGIVVLDDYGFPSCPGARKAADDYFAPLDVLPLCLPTGQAIVCKAPSR